MKKVALVTGGTQGIGAATSIALKEAGYRVVATTRKWIEEAIVFQDTHQIKTAFFDVRNYEAVTKAIAGIEQQQGPIHVLVNNAGVTQDSFLHKMPPEKWHEVLDTNLTGAFHMCRAVLPCMREREAGRIINISSVNALKGQIGQANYCASKAGLIGFTKAIALENASKGITANAIAPGYTQTQMTKAVRQDILDKIIQTIPLNRLAHPHEIASLICYLCKEEAAYITGATFNINGGQLCA